MQAGTLLSTLIWATGRMRTECFILGKKAMADLEREIEQHTALPAPFKDLAGKPPWGVINGVPVLGSKMAAPNQVEMLYRDPDGELQRGLLMHLSQWADMLAEGEIDPKDIVE